MQNNLPALNSMFSSNQKLDISCELNALPHVIDFAFNLSGYKTPMTRYKDPVIPAYQITKSGVYCLGINYHNHNDGESQPWTEFPFEYDPTILAQIVAQHIKKQARPEGSGTDGTENLGCRVLATRPDIFENPDELKEPMSCIICIKPYMLGYDK